MTTAPPPRPARFDVILSVFLASVAIAALLGCGYTGSASAAPAIAFGGSVHGGGQPVSGSSIQLYAAGSNGVGSQAQPLLTNPVQSDSNGNFSIPAVYHCPSSSSQVYVVAQGGDPGLSSGQQNPELTLAAMLGSCSSLTAASSVAINEVTTVGSLWPLASYITSATRIGSAANDTTFLADVASVPEFVNLAQGVSPGTPAASSYFAENSKLYTLANVLADCAGSTGGAAGDGTPCGRLFTMATPDGATPPADTFSAALLIAQNPQNAVDGIYSLASADTPFQPLLQAPPPDWTLILSYHVASPVLSLATGTYAGPQELTMSDATPGSTIHYTTDGTIPTASSAVYGEAVSVALTTTIQAIAVLQGSTSAVTSATLTIEPEATPARLAFVQQPSNTAVGAVISPAVAVAVEDAAGIPVVNSTAPVTLSLIGGTGLGGTLTAVPQKGIATFSNLAVSIAASGLTLSAASAGLPSATSASFSITAGGGAGTAKPAKLAFAQQPTSALTGATISPAVQVAVQDASGNTVTGATNLVTLALSGGGTLGGTLSAVAQNGLATFANLAVGNAGNYTLSASSAGLTSATSSAFTISTPGNSSNGTTILQSSPVSISAFAGGTFQVTYNWQAVPIAGQSSVFVDFIDSTGAVQFEDNVQPPVATSQWTGAVSYTHTVSVPAAAATGTYKIVAGVNSGSGNLSVVAGSGVTAMANGQYQVGTLTLSPTCSITSNGAVGDGVTDNVTAIQNTFNYAAANHCIALIPAGTFAYSGSITATGIAVAGTGAASILKPLSLTNESLTLQGNGGSVSNLAMVSAATTRLTTPWSGMIWVNNATNYYIENVLINNSSSTGILSDNSSGGYILNNTVENTLADSITQVLGSNNILVSGNRILNSGDDGVSNNSYNGDPGTVHAITVQGNTVIHNKGGRGLEVSGGTGITFAGNYVDNLDGYTDMYIASESEWNTQSVSQVTVSGNAFVDGGPNQGSAIVYNSEAGKTTISGVTISSNQFVNPKMNAVQFAGAGSETSILVENNTDYSTNQFSTSSNASASSTETGNQVLAPSAYTTPLVTPGGGCSFSGC